MRILPIQQYNYQKPTFTSWEREVHDKNGNLLYRNNTSMFRSDIEWNLFSHFVEKKFENVDKVNVYDFGCSDGSEAYTFLISLLDFCNSGTAKKFVPIKAYDIDKEAIRRAKKEGICLTMNERYAINWDKRFGVKAFFDKGKDGMYKPNAVLSKNVIFKKGDIKKDYKKIKPENSIVFARNFWPYLDYVECKELVKNLGEKMGDNSLLVIGNFDVAGYEAKYCEDFETILSKAGFKKTLVKYVYEKRPAVTNQTKFDSIIV